MVPLWSAEAFNRFTATLAQTERLPRPQFDLYQTSLLKRLVSFAFKESPFYREQLKPLFRNSDEPDFSAWRDIPILTRGDIADQGERMNPVRTTSELGAITTRKTSGTTGAGLSFRTCDIAQLAAECMMHRLYRWHGFDLEKPMASIRYYSSGRRTYPHGITEPHWCFAHPAPHYTLDYRTSVGEMMEWLVRRGPTYFLTFPSIAHDLAKSISADCAGELGLEAIVGISELVSSDTAADVHKRMGCKILQIYACAEMGCIALQSEADGELQVCEETVLVEILDDRGDPVRPGETGRVILTSLYNYATPFIRYEIGDHATLSDNPWPTGRTLRRLRRVTGRSRNCLFARDGSPRWDETVITPRLCQAIPTHNFQIRQPDAGALEIAYVADGGKAAKPDKQALQDHFAELLGGPVDVRLVPLQELTRSSGGKRERIVSALASVAADCPTAA